MLGNRYLTKIDDDEAGSMLARINEKNQPDLMMKQFLQEFQDEFQNQAEAAGESLRSPSEMMQGLRQKIWKYIL